MLVGPAVGYGTTCPRHAATYANAEDTLLSTAKQRPLFVGIAHFRGTPLRIVLQRQLLGFKQIASLGVVLPRMTFGAGTALSRPDPLRYLSKIQTIMLSDSLYY